MGAVIPQDTDLCTNPLALTEPQSAMGRVLLRKLPAMVEKRRRNAAYLSQEFARIPALRVVTPPDDVWHSYYKYDVYIRPEHLREGWERNRIQEAISAEGIPCMAGACSEIYLEKPFLNRCGRLVGFQWRGSSARPASCSRFIPLCRKQILPTHAWRYQRSCRALRAIGRARGNLLQDLKSCD